MKKIIIGAVVFLSAAMFTTASAQLRVNTSNNVDAQPKWGQGVSDYVEYYYLPDIDAYYFVPRKQFIYQKDGHWAFSSSLPADSKNFDLRSGNKVVVNQAGAYRYNAQHKIRYAGGSGVEAKSSVKASAKKAKRSSDKYGG
ncbi:MAG: hypothetical protein H7Y42_06515 [Chitinophagaceae bacterium]|nr:hypothetical protein [Chitinophagaceae bacterium]